MVIVIVGIIVTFAALKDHGIDDNTLTVFTSDNGAPIHGHHGSPLDSDMGGWGRLGKHSVGRRKRHAL